MTTMQIDRATVEQALEALEWHLARGACGADIEGVTGNLRAALAQQAEPVQEPITRLFGTLPVHDTQQAEPVEPVAWIESPHGAIRANPNYKFTFPSQLLHWQIPLYTALPQRKPLTLEEIHRATGHCGVSRYTAINIARAIERAIWEKNNGQA